LPQRPAPVPRQVASVAPTGDELGGVPIQRVPAGVRELVGMHAVVHDCFGESVHRPAQGEAEGQVGVLIPLSVVRRPTARLQVCLAPAAENRRDDTGARENGDRVHATFARSQRPQAKSRRRPPRAPGSSALGRAPLRIDRSEPFRCPPRSPARRKGGLARWTGVPLARERCPERAEMAVDYHA